MKTVAVVSSVGGAGRSTFVAQLATLLQERGTQTCALEFDPHNRLGYLLGLQRPALAGLGADVMAGKPWQGSAWRNQDGVLFLPFGALSATRLVDFESELAERPNWLAEHLEQLDLPGAVCLLDVARFPSLYAKQACAAADLVLVLLPPEPAALVAVGPLKRTLEKQGKHAVFVANKVVATQHLKNDILAMARHLLGEQLLPHRVHWDDVVSEAFASGCPVTEYAAHSQTAHDFQGLASWLGRTLAEQPA